MRNVLLIALLASLPSTTFAQRMGFTGSHFSGRSFQAERGNFGSGRFGRGPHSYLPWLDPFYADYLTRTGYPVAAEPPVIILQTPPAAAVPEPNPSPTQPLMIELRGNDYVQLSGEMDSGTKMIEGLSFPVSSEEPERKNELSRPLQSPRYTITLLLFRDGHHEEVSNYTIVDGTLYASASYFSAGAWVRKVDLSSLNLPETITANQSRHVQFRLPQAPNEVIVGP